MIQSQEKGESISGDRVGDYLHQFSGGMRQRVIIALACNLKKLIADEPTTALDVSIQAQILNLLKELQNGFGITYIFITHALSVVNYFSDDILVIYFGKMMEVAPSETLFANPMHPYPKALLSAIPIPSLHNRPERILCRGENTSPINPPAGCRFAPRCDYCKAICTKVTPDFHKVDTDHYVACHLYS